MSRMDGKATEGRRTFRRFVAPLAVCIAVAAGACSSESDDASGATSTAAAPTTTQPEATSSTTPPEQPPTSAPDGGSIDELESDTTPGRVLDPIAMGETADLGNGVTATVTATEAFDATAQQPGETGGPAVLVTVTVTNGSGAEIDLDYVAMDLTTATGAPISRVLVDPEGPFRGPLAPGATATGKYAFTIPAADRDQVTLTFKYSADTPMAVFTGDLPR